MKSFFSLCLLIVLMACQNTKPAAASLNNDCITGILMVKGICGQRVINVPSGSTGGLALNASWVNEANGDTLKNVFSVENVCDFPENKQVGDTVKFNIYAGESKECMTCKAYVPVPQEINKIKVCE
jgi:hypothetical protein